MLEKLMPDLHRTKYNLAVTWLVVLVSAIPLEAGEPPDRLYPCCLPLNIGCEMTTPQACETMGGLVSNAFDCFFAECNNVTQGCCSENPSGNPDIGEYLCTPVDPDTCINPLRGAFDPRAVSCTSPNDPNRCGESGACCTGSGCEEMSLKECKLEVDTRFPHFYFVPGLSCVDAPCDRSEGACCLNHPATGEPVCLDTFGKNCELLGGIFQSNVPCPDVDLISCDVNGGACCHSDGHCQFLRPSECFNLFGTYQGDDTACDPGLCPQPGACCDPFGCYEDLDKNCTAFGGQFQGGGTSCFGTVCPVPSTGACCRSASVCEDSDGSACESSGGIYYGDGMPCDFVACDGEPPALGACCLTDGTCRQMEEYRCDSFGGVYHGNATVCDAEVCTMPYGGCCLPDFDNHCQLRTPAKCAEAGGEYLGHGTDCDHSWCDRGTCCLEDGSCELVNVNVCFFVHRGVLFNGSGVACESTTCPPVGACCHGGDCSIHSQSVCVGPVFNGQYQGNGTNCDGTGCTLNDYACCLPDQSCEDVPAHDCRDRGGIQGGSGSRCATSPDCPEPPQACCLSDGDCTDVGVSQCQSDGGAPQGPGTLCMAVVCGQGLNACCAADRSCDRKSLEACIETGGSPKGPNTFCSEVECQPTGACCLFEGCRMLEKGECTALFGNFAGVGVDCSTPDACKGRCCLPEAQCLYMEAGPCFDVLHGVHWTYQVPCEAGCPQTGACCRSTGECSITSRDICIEFLGGEYRGDNVGCPADCGENLSACCFEDGRCENRTLEICQNLGGEAPSPGQTCDIVHCRQFGDIDDDGDQDLDDWALLAACLGGPDTVPTGVCDFADDDFDDDFDLINVATFQNNFSGPLP